MRWLRTWALGLVRVDGDIDAKLLAVFVESCAITVEGRPA
jgi:hypothetical protein